MSHGMRIWGANGALQLDESSFTVRVIYSAVISPAGSRYVDISISEINPANYSAVCVPISAYDHGGQFISAIMFTPVVFNGFVRVYFGSPAGNTGPTGVTPQRLMIMRYR